MLRELSTAGGFAREQDVLAKRGDKAKGVKQSLESLKTAGLLGIEYLLQCRLTSADLTRLEDKEVLEDGPVAALKCASCGRSYAEELCNEGFQITDLGRRLTEGSHWMTVWVTARLRDLGVPLNSITWNLSETSEEIDLVVELLGEIWIFELKDREFSPGDAHPFNYRRARYRADRAVIITTERVSKDAARILEEMVSRQRPRRRANDLLRIEGLGNVSSRLEEAMGEAALDRAGRDLLPVAAGTGFELMEVLKARQ